MKQAQRLERIEKLTKIVEHYKAKRQAGTITKGEKAKYVDYLKELAKLTRIERGFRDIMEFAKTYFQGEPPHDLLKPDTPSPPFHYELAGTLREVMLSPVSKKVAIAAPRSHAKTTIANNILLLWCVCYVADVGERYLLMLSDKQDNAKRFLDIVKAEIEGNELLRGDFGDLKGGLWNALEIITSNGVKIHAAGAGEALRGLRFGSYRPSILADDLESDQDVRTPERVMAMEDWWDRTVTPLGDPKRSKIIVIGTTISFNSLLYTLLTKRPDYITYRYQAVIEWPERLDLWEQFERIYHSRDEGDNPMEAARIAGIRAREFYETNKDEMERGARVLWPERMGLYELMLIRTTKRLAFLSEYQNFPQDESTKVFKTIRFYDPRSLDPDDLEYFYSLDSALGKSQRSDLTALITVARSKRSGLIYVVDTFVRRCSPQEAIKVLFQKATTYRYKDGVCDSTGFQSFVVDEIRRRSAECGLYVPCREYKTRNLRKEDRIEAAEPTISQYVFFLPTQTELIEQMELYPRHPKRDAIDALAQMLDFLRNRTTEVVWGKL